MKRILSILLILWLPLHISAKNDDTFFFQFNNEDLTDIVNQLAAKKEVNIVFPIKNPIASKVTVYIEEPFTLDQAWEKLYTILDIAGYSLIHKDLSYTIVKTEKDITKETLSIYINIPFQQIPDSDERIRYLYFLSNLKVTELDKSDLGVILKEVLPENATYQADTTTNSLILNAKANDIKTVVEIINKLDSATYQETFDIIPLYNTNPSMVSKIFEDILKINDSAKYRFETKKQLSEASYFPKNVRIIPLLRNNSILVLGTQIATERIRDFITKYIDIELESGKSILHIFKLQYMDADKVADVLRKVLETSQKNLSDQSKTEKGETPINPTTLERFFDEVIIQTDKPSKGGDETKYFGNNNIVIACRNDDWQRIKALLEELDKPRPQVIIEVLVADLTLEDSRALGAISRNPAELGFPPGVNIQSAQIAPVVVAPLTSDTPPVTLASTLASDLMTNTGTANASLVSSLQAGSTVVAFNDGSTGSTWGILQLLDLFSYSKVISHPHLIATNNTHATVKIGQSRLLTDQTSGSGGGTSVIKNKDIFAELVVDITPRIYTSATAGTQEDSVSLQVTVNITNFLPGSADITNNARLTRLVETNAMLKNGQILALGGLINDSTSNSVSESPIFGKIPLLGWLTKEQNTLRDSSNLTIFIATTIIEPRLRGGTSKYTEDYVALAKKYTQEGELFDSLQDPVTRWFFKTNLDPEKDITDFMNKDEFKRKDIEQEYKKLIDTEYDAMQEHPSKPQNKKTKRIVLSNVNPENRNISLSEQGIESEKAIQIASSTSIAPQHDPLLELLKKEQDEIVVTKVEPKTPMLPMKDLRDKLQKMLDGEINPLL